MKSAHSDQKTPPTKTHSVHRPITHKTWLTYWPVYLIALSSVLYASFPFALVLNRPYAFSGLTSALGGNGQPYAWFFNASDLVSAILAVGVLTWLYQSRRPYSRQLRLVLNFALLSVATAGLAALIPMPHETRTLNGQLTLDLLKDPQIVLHGLASFINSIGFVVAAVIWAIHWRRTNGRLWRWVYVGFVIFLSTVGFVLGQKLPGLAGSIQRLFITMYGVWFILLVIDILTAHRRELQS